MLTLNLLSEQSKLQYQFEIKKRFFIFLILAFCVMVTIFTLLLFAHYLFLRTHEKALATSLQIQRSDQQAEYITRTEQSIKDANTKLDILTKVHTETIHLAPVIESVASLVPLGLRIRNMSLNAQEKSVSIDGFSTTRRLVLYFDELLSLSNIVATSSLYSPIKNILKDKNIDFRFSFSLP